MIHLGYTFFTDEKTGADSLSSIAKVTQLLVDLGNLMATPDRSIRMVTFLKESHMWLSK